tara:strand:- start:2363 stop:3376 length:1014 start_codon:yes stop_codon:yes gene_type:complete
MTPIQSCILKKDKKTKPVWIMRQAGRYLPEFRKIRENNQDFIKLCLDSNLSSEITLQPINRFDLDAAIIFSDILMVPYALNQKVQFKKNFGPILGKLDIEEILKIKEEDFKKKLNPIYKLIKKVKVNKSLKNKDLIGFVGAPWTLAIYMLNKVSPKKNEVTHILENLSHLKKIIKILNKYLKVHILNQVKSGATVIKIFDSWAGLLDEKYLDELVYFPTQEIVEYTKSLNIPVICFPRNIKNYKKYCEIVKPDVISIDYNVDPKQIKDEINITIQGGLDPKILLADREKVKLESKKYLDIFSDSPYIFNLGHGILPETDPYMVEYLINFVKNYNYGK